MGERSGRALVEEACSDLLSRWLAVTFEIHVERKWVRGRWP